MLLFFGKPNKGPVSADENASRAARLVALRENFHRWKAWPEFAQSNAKFAPVALHWLQEEVKARRHTGLKAYGENARILVLNAHGNEYAFNDAATGASELAEMLLQLGIREAGTREIWLAACNNGKQTQDNSGPEPIVSALWKVLRQRDIDVKLYAPRGKLTYVGKARQPVSDTENVLRYDKVVGRTYDAKNPDGTPAIFDYPFEQAWVLAHA